jgi:tRNA(Ile)-lysidine synthase
MLIASRFRDFIVQHRLFQAADRVLLAVSGGKDSVLMAQLFNETGADFGIAHCNFKLRGAESDGDEDFVKALAAKLNTPFYTTSFDAKAVAEANRISVQMAARDLRYAWFEKIRAEHQFDAIAVAHHRNDSAETILLNLSRGTGLSGLHGILPKRGKIIRPLLFLDREEIDRIIDEERIAYREDSSNSATKYGRNKIRLEVIPKLKELNPNIEETFEENSRRFAEIEEFFTQKIDAMRDELFVVYSGDIHISLKDLKKLKPSLSVLYGLFKPFAFKDNVLSDLMGSWDGIPGKVFESLTHTLLLDRQKLILHKKGSGTEKFVLISEDDQTASWGGQTIIRRDAADTTVPGNNEGKAWLDAALLIFPLKLRSWKQGDSFYPLGMSGKKKLSDYFISKKIPLTQKEAIPVLENGNGDILWIAGYQSDNRYKVTRQSEKVIIFELQK